MGNCVPDETLKQEEAAFRKSQEIARLESLAIEEADRMKMQKHKERVMRRISPPKRKMISEEQLKITLNEIFDKYDTNKNGSLDVKEFTEMMNKISFKKTGEKKRYT